MPLALIQPEIPFMNELIPTKKEAEVLRAFAFGMAPNEIANSMDISVMNVGATVSNLYVKWHGLESARRGEIPYFVRDIGLLEERAPEGSIVEVLGRTRTPFDGL